MSRNFQKIVAIICVVLALVTMFGGFAFADEEAEKISSEPLILTGGRNLDNAITQDTDISRNASFVTLAVSYAAAEAEVREEQQESAALDIVVPASLTEDAEVETRMLGYTEIPVYVDGQDAGTGMKIGDSTYVPAEGFFRAIGVEMQSGWNQKEGVATFTGDGISIEAVVGEQYITANGRCFYTGEGGVMNINGTVVIPVRELARCFGIEVTWDAAEWAVELSTEGMAPCEPAESHYVEEDLYWLSRIIYAESGNQPLEGMIGVGNVVLNRVMDPSCPDTVYDVIFDDEYGVQFSVTENGSIYLEPSEKAIDAAKICLEGYNLVGDSLFFVNPEIGVSDWFASTRVFVASIGDHDFYA